MNRRVAKKVDRYFHGSGHWFKWEELYGRYTEKQRREALRKLYPHGHIGRYQFPFTRMLEDNSLKNMKPIRDSDFMEYLDYSKKRMCAGLGVPEEMLTGPTHFSTSELSMAAYDAQHVRWFGESWGAPLNLTQYHMEVPEGACCLDCGERVQQGDYGVVMYGENLRGNDELETTNKVWTDERGVMRTAVHLACFVTSLTPADPGVIEAAEERPEGCADGCGAARDEHCWNTSDWKEDT